jgi:hypothetical protein
VTSNQETKIMKTKFLTLLALTSAFSLQPSALLHASPLGTAFHYQGKLADGSQPANGSFDLRFTLYDADAGPGVVAGPLTNTPVAVSNGLFTVTLDFGSVFDGNARWLEIGVRTNGGGSFSALAPRQPVLPMPYSIMANSASNLLGNLPAAQLSGTIPATSLSGTISLAQLPTVVLTNNAAGITLSGAFSGSGAGLAGVPGSLTWQNVTGTSQQAQPNTGYLANNAAQVTITLPSAPTLGDIVRVSGAGAGGWRMAQNTGQSIQAGQFGGSYTNWNTLTNWTQTSAPLTNWWSIASSADGTRLAAAVQSSSGGVYTSTNAGGAWNLTSAPANYWRAIVSSADGTKLAAATTSYGIHNSTNSGATWYSGSLSANWTSLASSADGTKLAAVASPGVSWVSTSTNCGVNWTFNSAPTANWASIASSADGTKLAATASGAIYTSTNSGVSWTQTSAPGTYWGSIASSADGTKLAAVVNLNPGGIYTSTDSGGTWTLTSAPTNSGGWMAIASSADGTRLVAAAWSSIFASTDSGVTWTATSAQGPFWKSVACSADGTRQVAAASGGGIWTAQAAIQATTTPGTAGFLAGSQNSAIELQYVGNGLFMPLSYVGAISAY